VWPIERCATVKCREHQYDGQFSSPLPLLYFLVLPLTHHASVIIEVSLTTVHAGKGELGGQTWAPVRRVRAMTQARTPTA